MSETLLELSGIRTGYGRIEALHGLDVTIVGQSPGGAGATGALLNDAQEMLLGACKLGNTADNQVVLRGLSAAIRPVPAPGVAGVLATSARKVVTLVLSFILFKKPFTGSHATALAVLAVGVGLGIRAKHRKPR